MNVNKKKLTTEYKKRRKLGQFFTSEILVDYITKIFQINFSDKEILEPSFGGCSFIKYIKENSKNNHITAIDIDKKLCAKYSGEFEDIDFICKDFLSYETNKKFDIAIGNPPFNLKTKYNYYDSTEGFLIKSLKMLKPSGYLYFVMPSTILRNKQYQRLRELIINNYKIEGIINTSDYEFLGADIETIFICIKNEKVKQQKYFYISDNSKKEIILNVNKRFTILLNNTKTSQKLKEKVGNQNLGLIFDIYRGKSDNKNSLKGRQINYYNHYLKMKSGNEYFIGLQNIAYRFTSNLIRGDKGKINDTITLLVPKTKNDCKYLCFISEFLNSSIANYFLHVNALNGCKLTIHIDKYYIEDMPVPSYDSSFNQYITQLNKIGNTKEVGEFRNNYFYKLFNLTKPEIVEIESLWTYPKFREKHKYVLKEEI